MYADPIADGTLMVLSGRANRPLSEAVADILGCQLGEATVRNFEDGEIFVRIDDNVRGRDLYIIQSTCPPSDNILELLLLLDAARRASAARITAVIPYFGYARQDRKDQPRVAIGAKLMANMIVAAGAHRVLSIDFHQHQLQGFFDIPVDHLYAAPVFTRYFREKQLDNLVVVSPDVGSAKMARGFAKRLGGTMGIIDKRRPAANVSEVMHVIGDVEGKDCILSDDMIDTGGTLAQAARALKERGARDVYACATHALLSGPAVQRLRDAPFTEIVVTDTIPVPPHKQFETLRVLSTDELLAKAVRYTHVNESVSSLFEAV
jgi:ribose-phosphate pyrophosphokinase